MDIHRLTSPTRFWTLTLLSVLICSILFMLTNRINNFDELHYLSLAWEMHKHHEYLLPIILGHADIQKPPLLYWLINLGWSIFGISTTWPLMLIMLFNMGCLFTTWHIAQKLFPENPLIAQLAVIILATSVFWFYFFDRIRFDGLLTLLTALYINFTINMYRQRRWTWTVLAGLSLGLGFLAKGAAILIFVLPFFLLLPRYETEHYAYSKWLGHFIITLLLSIAIVMLWAIPLYHSLGKETFITLFFTQQHSRLVFNHHWGELPGLLLSFLPWIALPTLLCNVRYLFTQKINRHVWLLGWTILLSGLFFTFFVLMHVKRYLLPLYPYFAILLAYLMSQRLNLNMLILQNRILISLSAVLGISLVLLAYFPFTSLANKLPPSHTYALWGALLCIAAVTAYLLNQQPQLKSVLSVLIGLILINLIVGIVGINGVFTRLNDVALQALTQEIKDNQARGIPQANLISGGYQAFDFKGRLPQPLPFFDENSSEFKQWASAHPEGILYLSSRKIARRCMIQRTLQLKGSDLVISILPVKDYLMRCQKSYWSLSD